MTKAAVPVGEAPGTRRALRACMTTTMETIRWVVIPGMLAAGWFALAAATLVELGTMPVPADSSAASAPAQTTPDADRVAMVAAPILTAASR